MRFLSRTQTLKVLHNRKERMLNLKLFDATTGDVIEKTSLMEADWHLTNGSTYAVGTVPSDGLSQYLEDQGLGWSCCDNRAIRNDDVLDAVETRLILSRYAQHAELNIAS